jgi:hypothetical protein
MAIVYGRADFLGCGMMIQMAEARIRQWAQCAKQKNLSRKTGTKRAPQALFFGYIAYFSQ